MGPEAAPSGWTAGRIAGAVVVTLIGGALFALAGRALLASDENPEAGLVEQAVFRRLVVIPEGAEVLIEPAWAATYYGTLLIDPQQASELLPGGTLVAGDESVPNSPLFSFQEHTTENGWTCLVYADLHDPSHPSPLISVEHLEPDRRAAYESGQILLANVGTICGTEDQFPER